MASSYTPVFATTALAKAEAGKPLAGMALGLRKKAHKDFSKSNYTVVTSTGLSLVAKERP